MASHGRGRAIVAELAILLIWAWSSIRGAEGADQEKLVTNLPGLPAGVNYTQYAGYVTVNETNGREPFYWFFTADHPDAASKPLAIWLSGGPGCSSVGGGFLGELGPFYPKGDLNDIFLSPNKNTWIKEANIIFLESPVAVGFSYSNTSSDYSLFTDKRTAEDALQFLLNWYKKFPEYKANEFYLLGESYAGHYIPTFSREIVNYNDAQGPNDFHINFIGWLVGNPWTDAYYNNLGATDWWHSHDLISDELYDNLTKNCNFSVDTPVDYNDPNPVCNYNASVEINLDLDYINEYSIYTPYCNKIVPNNTMAAYRKSKEKSIGLSFTAGATPDPCAPDLIGPYLNSLDVKQALHVYANITWMVCSDAALVNYSVSDIIESMLPIYTELTSRGLRIWIFSGDTDGVCPTTTARYAINSLNLDIQRPWQPWQHDTQVGGYNVVYKGLTWTTVRDAGHMVPFFQPGRSLSLFKHYLADTPLPSF